MVVGPGGSRVPSSSRGPSATDGRSRRWPWVVLTLAPILVIVVTGVWLLVLMHAGLTGGATAPGTRRRPTTVDGSTADRQPDGAPVAAPVNDSPDHREADPARLDKVVNLCKRRGFVFPSGEIYGGTRSAWDYGPLGVELKENIKRQWWRTVVQSRDDIVGLDSSVILPRAGLGGLRPRRRLHRPADRVPELPQALPGRPPRGGVRGHARAGCRRTAWPTSAARTAAPRARGPSRATST